MPFAFNDMRSLSMESVQGSCLRVLPRRRGAGEEEVESMLDGVGGMVIAVLLRLWCRVCYGLLCVMMTVLWLRSVKRCFWLMVVMMNVNSSGFISNLYTTAFRSSPTTNSTFARGYSRQLVTSAAGTHADHHYALDLHVSEEFEAAPEEPRTRTV